MIPLIGQLLTAFGPLIAKLIENALSDEYDPEVEKQQLMEIQRSIYEIRLQKLAEGAP